MSGRIGILYVHRGAVRFLCVRSQSFMLIEEMHHALHRFRRRHDILCASSASFQDLRCRKREHHSVQHHIRCSQYTFAFCILIFHGTQFGFLVKLLVLRLHLVYICFQFIHIFLRTCKLFVSVCHLIQVQEGHFRASAYTNRILIRRAAARILHIQRTSGFPFYCGKLRNRNIISSNLQVRYLLEH